MSLTSYRAAPPRDLEFVIMRHRCDFARGISIFLKQN